MTFSARISQLQSAMVKAQLDAYLVPMVDAFQSEYIPESASRLPYMTGFTGSAGMAVFRADGVHVLFVDGRYTLQAAQQVDASVIHVINSGEVSFREWLKQQPGGLRIGYDPWLVTEVQRAQWQEAASGCTWVALEDNLVDAIWPERPAPPTGEVRLHALDCAGATYAEKRTHISRVLAKHRADAVILTLPDGINWLLNLRGADIPYNPLLLAYLALRADGTATLWMHPRALSAEVTAYLREQQVQVEDIQAIYRGAVTREVLGARVLIDTSVSASGWLTLLRRVGAECIFADDPSMLPKAIKNAVEIAGARDAHLRDGLALCRFLHWLESETRQGRYPDELSVVARLEEFRRMDAHYRGPSFATIAGSGPNGAIVHYRADVSSNRRTRAGELLLIDSGGQYPGGTTDVTRTVFIGGPSGGVPGAVLREQFTRVLKGHIALARVRFPRGTGGVQLDALARQYVWEAGLDYDHGTGHGVGAYLCVHEGPQRISKRGSSEALQPGMILSNEPGYYHAGSHGIRIENLVLVKEVLAPNAAWMLEFETLTLAPIDTRLIEIAMLTSTERNWLNAYHRRVYDTHVSALDLAARTWLMHATRAV